VFSELKDGTQTGTAYYATGPQARQAEPAGDVLITGAPVGFDASARTVQAGPVRLFTGVRSDPFFADADGSFHGFQWTGQDAFADRNILSIALEVPNDMLSGDPEIGVWGTVSVRRDGAIVQVDRGGHPTINPFVNPNNIKNEYNLRQPADDLANYLELWSKFLDGNGYPPEEARKAALIVLPDILRYDRTRPTAYPNGRALTDDAFSARFAWMSNGKVGPDGLKPHDDMLTEFPYLCVQPDTGINGSPAARWPSPLWPASRSPRRTIPWAGLPGCTDPSTLPHWSCGAWPCSACCPDDPRCRVGFTFRQMRLGDSGMAPLSGSGRSGGTQTIPSLKPAEPIPNAALKRSMFTSASRAVISTSWRSSKYDRTRVNSSSVTSTGVRITATA
jgi:hypothetical protein